MKQRKYALLAYLILILSSSALLFAPIARTLAAPVPSQLSDQQFWNLSRDLSEEDGVFRSDNLLSNETTFQWVIPDLVKSAKQGRVYMGVGPEQNFTYIAALKPAMAVIVDIRHGNTDVHLMYKALFELSKDRAEFVSRLFSLKRPNGLTAQSSASQIFDAFLSAGGSKELYDENLKAIQDQLMKKHGFPLTAGDLDGIKWALSNFYQFGPSINYNSSLSMNTPPAVVGAAPGGFNGGGGRGGNNQANYASLMEANNGNGQYMSYLASEESFLFLKDLESRNMLIPVVGDFGGDKALRAVGKYLKTLDATVSAFYLSNVEQYLVMDGKWDRFCANAISLPLDNTSMFIRSGNGGPFTLGGGVRNGRGGGGGVGNSSIANMLPELTPGCGSK